MASGYDLSSRNTFRLLKGRLGIYEKRPFDPSGVDPDLEGVFQQATRFRVNGGNRQQERMIYDKRRSLDRALWNSYQAAEVVRLDAEYKKPVRALINPNKLKQDYDDKIISIGYEYNFKPGDVFEWVGTKTHWLIYLQDLTELAYFRGDIRKCSYEIAWEDEDGKHSTYAALRGPVETRIDYIQKHGISLDNPNFSLNILLPKNEETLKYFKRYTKFYLQNDNYPEKICWRVEAIDWLSTPGILEINAVEYYANETEDDLKKGIVGGLIVIPEDPNPENLDEIIKGDTFIKPRKEYEFTYKGNVNATWSVGENYPVKLIPDGKTVKLRWTTSFSGQFDLYYGNYKKTIIVESLF